MTAESEFYSDISFLILISLMIAGKMGAFDGW